MIANLKATKLETFKDTTLTWRQAPVSYSMNVEGQTMTILRGLIIADPWIGYILDGSKTWEMRSTPTAQRGWFGLIRKGTGEIHGIARLVGCGVSLSQAELLATIALHRIPERMILSGATAKWVVPWELADVRALPQPIPYSHRSGAVTWIGFDPEVQDALAQYVHETDSPETGPAPARNLAPHPSSIKPEASAMTTDITSEPKRNTAAPDRPFSADHVLGRSILTAANIRNNHFYLTGFLNQFPPDVFGGSNKSSRAPKDIAIDWGGQSHIHSDIDKSKRFFRSRSWIGDFFLASGATEGDTVIVYGVDPYSVQVRLQKEAHGNLEY